jgi:serine/threonine-protein kinase
MLTPGTMLGGRYRLDERIAGGGMGDVWRGTDEVLGRTVAVKVLLHALLEEPGFAERFRGEARTMATINHPGVVDVYDYGNENATAFLIMEYVEGDALSRTLGRVGRLTPARTMALVAQAADALQAAHVKGIVHRDVKPGNLLVRPNGTLVLTDFGIARSAQAAQLTMAGSVLGTASYISPEQAAGQQASPLSDVYALGVVAYQCLSGHRPFEGDNPIEIAMKHVRDLPPPLPGDIPPAVCQIVERAMAKDPAAHWASAAGLAQVARQTAAQLSGGPTATMASPPAPVSGSPVSGSPVSGTPLPGSPVPLSQQGPGGTPGVGGTRMFTGPVGGPGASAVSGPPAVSAPPGGGYATPTSPVPAGFGSQAPGGQYARGTAGVPPPPTPQETGYTYLRPASGAPGGQDAARAPGGPAAPGGQGGAARQNRSGGLGGDQRRTLLVAASAMVVLIVLIAGVAIALAVSRGGGSGEKQNNPPAAPASHSAAPTGKQTGSPRRTTASPAAGEIVIDCATLIGQQRPAVELKLRQKFKVNVDMVDAGGRNNEVVDITPCRAHAGDTITVRVSTGNGGDRPSSAAAPQPSCSGLPLDNDRSCPSSKKP